MRLNNVTEANVIEVRGWATRTTLDIIDLAGMDHDINSSKIPTTPSVGSTISVQFCPLCRNILQEKRDTLKSDRTKCDVGIITVALKSAVFTNGNLVDQMMAFLEAGHGATSHTFPWAACACCRHGEIQTRLREEIRDAEPTISAADRPTFLTAFCNEVLRFCSSVPTIVRGAICETTVSGYRIPKGTTFTIFPGVTNLDPELWGPDTDTFDPERWMRESCARGLSEFPGCAK
ncbi:uncharacterized protein Z518_09463 [Rhinocladiella mackenziei CBS 650.93]|uniref:Rhinocladiella mackenziei CBS 650.93 unplaced genomic scaffold supercont1.7, whole genome shotgun sequence n=1 Tax=Rhinocladiella mackenziei CBS 650.93 TaxID=1442369 RepID=A0A0D2FI89_9EURO|nr:uncharacterized protein Z518_09463 [Rhinocladiella mackenziei CBS 650.93]KIX01737.1 hypothetical protein Z518_09463 [Rhinocladiella mackenziei CBS 650.93]